MNKEANQFFTEADKLAGKIATVTYAKKQKVRKSAPQDIEIVKRSTFQVRVGVEYANQKAVKEGHEDGTIERKGLPPSLVKITRSRYYNTKRDVAVLAVAPVNNENSPRSVEWLLDGVVVPFEQVEPYLYAQKKGDFKPLWYTLDFPAIESLSGVE